MKQKTLPPLDVLQRYSVDEACAYLRCSRRTLYQRINASELPVIRDGHRTYVPGTAIAERSRLPDHAA